MNNKKILSTNSIKEKLYQQDKNHWDQINALQAKQMIRQKQNPCLAICLDKTCQDVAYFAPINILSNHDFFAKMLTFVKGINNNFIPVLRCDLWRFPTIFLPPLYTPEYILNLHLKLSGKLIIKPYKSQTPFSYNMGKHQGLKISAYAIVNECFSTSQWNARVTLDPSSGNLNLSLFHKASQQIAKASINVSVTEVSLKFSFNAVKWLFADWVFNGNYGIKIAGTILPRPHAKPTKPRPQPKINSLQTLEIVAFIIVAGAMTYLTGGADLAILAI